MNKETLLKTYKKLCDAQNHDYEFHYVEDMENNEGSLKEINSYILKHVNEDIINEIEGN